MTTTTTTTTTATTTGTTDATTAIHGFLAAVRGEHGTSLVWADDAVLDAVVPNWRMTVRGGRSIEGQFRTWFCDPGTLEELRRHPIPGGEVIEFTVTWLEDGVPHAARQAHILELDAAGRIARDRMWCGGRWPASLLADMAAVDDA
ncbi:MAG TPA: hypothetical protein VKU86_11845 [Acidimicrobiales bacterium]|nr:hypothetical protein [Acidimicrobiales bacterium]